MWWTPISVITFVALSMLREANGFLNRRILLCDVRILRQDASLAALEANFTRLHFDRDNIKEAAMTVFGGYLNSPNPGMTMAGSGMTMMAGSGMIVAQILRNCCAYFIAKD